MIYLYLDKNTIKVLSLSKTLLGQYYISHFQKTHQSDLLEKGIVKNVDLLASAIKEALTLASPKEIKEKDVTLILPQESFEFIKYDVPKDISETAILPFIRDKVRTEVAFDIEESFFDYLLVSQNSESKVLFFAQLKDVFQKYQEVFRLLGLSVVSLIPETLAFFKLFEKTLKKDKKEHILYVFFEDQNSFGYLYDYLGLLKKEKYVFKGEIETVLKTKIEELEKENIKLNRIILSGKNSEKIRQDFFTRNVGVWTNPLKKIITNFYQEYLKLFILTPQHNFSLLDFDVCLGAFIFDRENKSFSILKGGRNSSKRKALTSTPSKTSLIEPGKKRPLLHARDMIIFLISFVFSFIIIFSFSKLDLFKSVKFSLSTPKTKTATPTPAPPTPTPTLPFAKDTLKIKVINGGGVRGKASEVKDLLKDKGYGEILTGNADNFDYEKTEAQVKDDKKAIIPDLKEDLKDYVTLEKVSSLEKDSSADLILTIGKDFK